MAFKFLRHTWQKVIFSVFLIFIAVVLVLGYFMDQHWSPILNDKIRDAVLKSTDSLYIANFSNAEFHVLQGKVVIFNITLKPDTVVYNRRKLQHLAPNNLVEFSVKRMVILGINPIKIYFKHVVDISQVVLSQPEAHMRYQLNHLKDTSAKDNRTPWQKISKTLHYIHIGDIFLNDIKFRYDDYSGNKLEVSELKEMNLHASDFLIDSATQTDKKRLLYCSDMLMELNNYTGKTPNGLYTYTVKYLKLSTQKAALYAEGLMLQPAKTGVFFDKSKSDRFTLYLDALQLNNFDFLSYQKYRSLTAASLYIRRGKFQVFNNPSAAPPSTDKIKSFPHVALENLKFNLKIDTIKIRHLDINYTETGKKSKKPGYISFNNTEGQFLNLTNNKEALLKNNICSVKLTSYFMDRGEFNVLFNFNLTDKNAAYNYKGNLGPMDLKMVNQAAMPLAMVKINSGHLKQLNFDFKANGQTASGEVSVLYNDLKVTVLKADTEEEKLKRMTIASLYANVFIIKHDNPDEPGGIPRTFHVNYTRPITSPFFKYTWTALLTGIKPCVGFDKQKQEATKQLTAQSVINKQNRQIKKALRKQRRAERRLRREEKAEENMQ